jgi:hypothetical protein
MSSAVETAATTTPEATSTGNVKFIGMIWETIQVYDEHYKLVDGASSLASDVLKKYPSILTTAESSYQLAKAKLVPESYQETVETVEKEILGLDKKSLSTHAERLDSKIETTLKAVQGGGQAIQEKFAETREKIVNAANEKAMYGLETVESGIDYVLPDSEDATDASSQQQPGEAANQPLVNKALGISKKAQRKLRKKALEGLTDLRFRPEQLSGAVDLIQYNRFLDVRSVMGKHAGAAKTVLHDEAVKAWKVLESSEIVVKVKPVLDNLEGKADGALAKIKTVIVEPAREFYTTVVIQFVNDPSQAAKEFRSNVEKAVGPEWTKSLETPTMELWETMTELYQKMEKPPAGAGVEAWKQTLVANVGILLETAWSAAAFTTSSTPLTIIDTNGYEEVLPPQNTEEIVAESSPLPIEPADEFCKPDISAPPSTPTKIEDFETEDNVFTEVQLQQHFLSHPSTMFCDHITPK